MTAAVPAGIDYEGVSRFFAEHVPGGRGPLEISLLSGGRSNLTYLVRSGEREWVLRRPPLGHVLPTAHDMAREYRVITALHATGFPVPETFALCEDPAVNGMPFYVMEYKRGVIVGTELPEGYAARPEERRRMSLALIDTLVRLHSVDYNAVGLGDFGRPEGFLERQVRRWLQQWERSKTRDIPEIEELIRRLRAAMPESGPPTIVHGDYRLGNMILAFDDPGKVEAVLDWEMATVGDPLTDLGYTLGFWGDRTDDPERIAMRPGSGLTAQEGFLTREELVAEYAKRSGRDVSNMAYYHVFAYYKLAVISEGIYARHVQGLTLGEGFEGYGRQAENLVHMALAVADASPDPRLRGEA
jgi:aminoglycoside phosphotransferase (APT) family kinase protein